MSPLHESLQLKEGNEDIEREGLYQDFISFFFLDFIRFLLDLIGDFVIFKIYCFLFGLTLPIM